MLFWPFILILAVPAGYLIAWLSRDELVDGRAWFIALGFLSFLTGMVFYLKGRAHITLTSFFILIVSAVSLIKSKDKKWTRKI